MRTHAAMAALALCLALAGCGGSGGGGEPTVTQTVHDELQAELDAALAQLDESEAARAAAQAQLLTAQASVATLTADLETANASVASLAADLETANASVTSLAAELRTANASVTRLTAQIGSEAAGTGLEGMLAEAQADVARLTAELATATGQVATLTGQLTVARSEAASLRRQLADARTEATEAEERAEEAEADAQAEINRQVQAQTSQRVANLEANQRADNLKTELEANRVGATASPSPVDMTVPTRGSLRLVRGGHSTGSLDGAGLRSTTLRLTSGADSGKTVVYTDLELSRVLLDHYGDSHDATDMTRLDISDAELGTGVTITGGVISETSMAWDISHGLSASLAAVHVDDDDNSATPASNDDTDPTTTDTRVIPPDANDPEDPRDFYSGSLHGVSGRFVCGGADCQITLMPGYSDTPNNQGRYPLDTVTITGAGGLFFKPNSATATIPLFTGGPVGHDSEYMVFGYWREDPTSAAGEYEFGVFAEAVGTGDIGTFPGTVTYDGTAVGAYVEQDPNDPVDTHRQGEFTADVFLEATSATDISGTIDDFVATPTGGSAAPRTSDRWVVTLHDDTGRPVSINLADGGSGTWTHEFVPHHATASPDVEAAGPSAVTGVFDVAVTDFVHILGAYGAEKR